MTEDGELRLNGDAPSGRHLVARKDLDEFFEKVSEFVELHESFPSEPRRATTRNF